MRKGGEVLVAAGSLCKPRARMSVERSPSRCQDAWPAAVRNWIDTNELLGLTLTCFAVLKGL